MLFGTRHGNVEFTIDKAAINLVFKHIVREEFQLIILLNREAIDDILALRALIALYGVDGDIAEQRDAVTVDGKSHPVKYISGDVGNRSNIVSIVFGQNIEATGGPDGSSSNAFSGCDKLTSVTLNAKLQILGTYTFLNCYNLENINLVDCTSLTTIKASAIEDCDYVRQITVPASVTTIEKNAFYSIDSLRTVIFAKGSKLTTMGEGAFRDNKKLESINIEACTSLTVFPDSWLYNCPSVKSLIVPASVETFGRWMFDYTNNIETITFLAPAVPGDFYSYKDGLKTVNIGPGVKSIGEGAFRNCYYLKTITIDESVSNLAIDKYAFAESDRLPEVNLPAGVVSLGNGAFRSCDSLCTVTFAKGCGITEIPYECFAHCLANLETITLPDAVQTIGAEAFYNCKALKEVNFGKGVTTINNWYTFSYCEKLEKLVLPGTNNPFTDNVWMPADIVLYVHPEMVDLYRENDYTKNYHIMPIGKTTAYTVTTTAGGQLQSTWPRMVMPRLRPIMVRGRPRTMWWVTPCSTTCRRSEVSHCLRM